MQQNSQENTDKELNLKLLAKIVGSIIIVLWLVSLVVLGIWVNKGNEIGDSFGAVNALFSGLALAGIILTILMQRDELKLQRKELELTRDEMELTRDEFAMQNQTLKIQRFETTLFNLFSIHHQIVADMETSSYTSKNGNRTDFLYKGRRVFQFKFGNFIANLDEGGENFDIAYGDFHQNFNFIFGHYLVTP